MNSHVCSASPALSSSLLQLGPTSCVHLILTSAGNASGWKTSKSYILHVAGPLLALTWQAGYSRVAATAHRLQLGIMKQSTNSCIAPFALWPGLWRRISWTNWSCNIMYLHSRVIWHDHVLCVLGHILLAHAFLGHILLSHVFLGHIFLGHVLLHEVEQ